MRPKLYGFALFSLFTLVPSVFAAPITVNFVEAVVSGPTVVALPILLGPGNVNVRLKFFVPDYATLSALNSLSVSVNLYDDAADEPADKGGVVFVLNGAGFTNIVLDNFTDLEPYTPGSPYTSTASLAGADLDNALIEIQGDGIFFVRVNRNPPVSSDFFVQSASVTIDGTLAAVPEPSTMGLLGAGLGAGFLFLRRRARD